MQRRPFRTIALIAASLLASATASAALVSGTYTVRGSDFTGIAPPFASITESFTISFDNATTVSQRTAGIVLNASTITPISPLAYTYIAGADTLIVGGAAATVAGADPASTDFALVISNASNLSSFSITSLSYSVGNGAVYTSQTNARETLSVPEPSTLALCFLAVPALCAARRRGRAGSAGAPAA